MKRIIILLVLSSMGYLYANTSIGSAPKFKSEYRDDQTTLEMVQKLIGESTTELSEKDPKQYFLNLEQASNFKSGLASFRLSNFIFDQLVAKNQQYIFSDLRKYSLVAAQYGFPQAYDLLGQAYSCTCSQT